MSGNKMTDTKQQDSSDADFGFHSGPTELSSKLDLLDLSDNKSEADNKSELKQHAMPVFDSGFSTGLNLDSGDSSYFDSQRSESSSKGGFMAPIDKSTQAQGDNKSKAEDKTELKQHTVFDSGLGHEGDDDQQHGKMVDDVSTPSAIETTQLPHLSLKVLYMPDDDGDTQLHVAAAHGNEKPMSILIRLCPSKIILDLPNNYGQTALHLAVMGKSAVITRMLVLAGADIGIRDRRGETPLHKATATGNVKCIQALLMPVQTRQKRTSEVLDQKNYNGQACVHIAASLGQIETLQALLFYGANINAKENLSGGTPLHIAANRGDISLIQFLQRCSSCDQRAEDFSGHTARRQARYNQAAKLFERHEDSDTDSDDDDIYDEEMESLFDKIKKSTSKTMVA